MTSISRPDGGRRRFRPALVPTLATLVAFLILVGLGTWQVQRLHWKEALIASATAGLAATPVPFSSLLADPAAADYRRVTLEGTYEPLGSFAFGVAVERDELGAKLVTPLRLEDGRIVLVDRGYLPERLLPPELPADLVPEGVVHLTGIARYRGADQKHLFMPGNYPEKRRWYWWDLPAMSDFVGGPVAPVEVVLDARDGPGPLPVIQPVSINFPNNHLQYVITWYGLAAALVAVYVAFSLQPREP
jgi:surfeit locus 1 family protein